MCMGATSGQVSVSIVAVALVVLVLGTRLSTMGAGSLLRKGEGQVDEEPVDEQGEEAEEEAKEGEGEGVKVT